jgi:hypothetical protein
MWHNKKKAPEAPERLHFDAIGSSVVLFPGTWYYHMSGESHYMDESKAKEKEVYRKTLTGVLNFDARFCVSRNKVHFIEDWRVQTTKWAYFAKDGREISQDEAWGHRDGEGRPFKQKEVELSENEWKTAFRQGIPCELHQKLYGPLKILV